MPERRNWDVSSAQCCAISSQGNMRERAILDSARAVSVEQTEEMQKWDSKL